MIVSDLILIDRGSYYEIKDYKPIVKRDKNGNVITIINCPYISKVFFKKMETEK